MLAKRIHFHYEQNLFLSCLWYYAYPIYQHQSPDPNILLHFSLIPLPTRIVCVYRRWKLRMRMSKVKWKKSPQTFRYKLTIIFFCLFKTSHKKWVRDLYTWKMAWSVERLRCALKMNTSLLRIFIIVISFSYFNFSKFRKFSHFHL
jgi:hypothetical protein